MKPAFSPMRSDALLAFHQTRQNPAALLTASAPSELLQSQFGFHTSFRCGEGILVCHSFDSIRKAGSIAGRRGGLFQFKAGKRVILVSRCGKWAVALTDRGFAVLLSKVIFGKAGSNISPSG